MVAAASVGATSHVKLNFKAAQAGAPGFARPEGILSTARAGEIGPDLFHAARLGLEGLTSKSTTTAEVRE